MSRSALLFMIALPTIALTVLAMGLFSLVARQPESGGVAEPANLSIERAATSRLTNHRLAEGETSTVLESSQPNVIGLPSSLARQERRRGRRGYNTYDPSDRRGIPTWDLDSKFEHDVFRFVRVKYNSWGGRQYHRLGRWATDFPDSDLNFSYRLQQLTSIKVNPEPLSLAITDERLFDYPFLYMIEPGTLFFTEAEIVALRRYLLNGGFLMVDDFWGTAEWLNFEREIKKVFPDREIKELDLSHKIFHYVYDLKEKPQIPSITHWQYYGDTSERGYDSDEVHYKAIEDDNGRIMVMICHNTDLGDGWEREGESREYFERFSEKHAYPLGINIVLYAMTQ